MSYWDSADGNLGTTILIMLCSLSDKKEAFQHFALSGNKKCFKRKRRALLKLERHFIVENHREWPPSVKILLVKVVFMV